VKFEREVSLGGFTVKIMREGLSSPPYLAIDENGHTQEYLDLSLLRAGWAQDIACFNIGLAQWTKPLTRLTLFQLEKEAEKLLGELYYYNHVVIIEEYRKLGLDPPFGK